MSEARQPLRQVPGKTTLAPGAKVGKYTLDFLAAGGMSVVYRGHCGDEVVALKEVAVDNTDEVPSLLAEKSLLERLDHPGVIKYLALLVQNGFYYLVVEYVEGSPMTRWIGSAERAGDDQISDWGCQLTEIFDYLHAAQPPIIYRDLKPGNVMVTPSGKIKLIDFGIARLHKGHGQQDTSLLGSMQTASPEHYGMSETDARSDIYTLGMTLYLLFSAGTMRKEAFLVPSLATLRPDLPQHVIEAIDKSVRLEPKERHQSMAEFRRALRPEPPLELPEPLEEDSEDDDYPLGEATVGLPMMTSPHPVDTRPGLGKASKAGILLVAVLVAMVLLKEMSSKSLPDTPGPTPAALSERNFPVDLFAGVSYGDTDLVMLGEEIGLFRVSAAEGETGAERSLTIANRLNTFYRQSCFMCGASKLEPGDVKVGDYAGSTVVFYAHQHGDSPAAAGPLLLATVTQKQAREAGKPPRFVACYWRDLLRDTVQLSRGEAGSYSVLGEDLEQALTRARVDLSGEGTRNLQTVLRQLTGSEAGKLQDLYLRVPDRAPTPDEFKNLEEYKPLRI